MVTNGKQENLPLDGFVEKQIKKDTDQTLLSKLKEGLQSENQEQIDKICFTIYEKYRTFFFKWIGQFQGVDEEIASDIYQQTFTVFFLNVRRGKLDVLTCRLSTYLFGIGKRVLFEYRRKNPVGEDLDTLPQDVIRSDFTYVNKLTKEENKERIASLLNNLGPACQQVLTLRYFYNFSMDAIAEDMNYKSPDVAKKTRYECIKKLRKIFVKSGLKQEDFLNDIDA